MRPGPTWMPCSTPTSIPQHDPAHRKVITTVIFTATGVTYTADDVKQRFEYGDLPGQPQTAVFWLAPGSRVADIRFPGHYITGPARVEFIRYPHAGFSTSITHAHTLIGE